MEPANEAPRAYTPSRLAVKSSQPLLSLYQDCQIRYTNVCGILVRVWTAKVAIKT